MSGLLNPYALGGGALTLIGENVANSATVSLPGGTAAGDYCYFGQVVFLASDTSTWGTPSGYTIIKRLNPNNSGIGFDFGAQSGGKVLVGGETQVATGSSTGSSGRFSTFCRVFRYSGGPILSFTSSWNTGEVTTGNPISQTVDASAQAAPVVVDALGIGDGSFSFTGSPALDATLSDSMGIATAVAQSGYKIWAETPTSMSVDMPDTGGFNLLLSGWTKLTV